MREVTQCFPVPYLLRTPAPWITPQTSSRYASPPPRHSSCWDWLYLLDTPVWIIKMSNIIELNYILFLTGEEDKRISVNTFLKNQILSCLYCFKVCMVIHIGKINSLWIDFNNMSCCANFRWKNILTLWTIQTFQIKQ